MEDKNVYSNYRWLVLLAGSVAILSLYINMIVFAPVLGDIASNLQIDVGSATNLMMGFVLAVACVLTFGGVVCDKCGITAALVLGLLCTSVPAVLMPIIGSNYGTVFLCRLVQGASVGFVFATIGPIMALWFPPKEQGLAAGILFGSLSLGSTVGVVCSPALLTLLGSWQKMVAFMSIPGWIAIVLALVFTRRQPSPAVLKSLGDVMASGVQVSFIKALALPKTWLITLVIVCNAWGLYVLYNLVPPYLASPASMGVGLPPVTAGNISLALTAVGIFAPFVGGLFFDKIARGNPKPAVLFGFLISGGFAYLILLEPVFSQMGYLVLCLMIAGWGIPFMNASLSAFISMNYPPSILGRMVGFCYGVGTFGGALGLYLGGKAIATTGSFYWALAMITIVSVFGMAIILLIREKKTSVSDERCAAEAS
ncbi:MFS transporter [Syntrophotalea acetylenica]|uniref:Major facilitator superfamily (MFS) profile domain-containing protein n=1 Tax=Syntrophotalea acetylenica TaxID=29542 RepID=A0A1L3GDD6_SYNAC|nr:MFS transporter [Syntrophotalea acetylenica]APG23960.1 hypothetical protein A7E75_02175 [Syntrophotalea acetylenica]APG44541.1 hypothetical protein A6070_10790 [Syntrophotalea acetylenica]